MRRLAALAFVLILCGLTYQAVPTPLDRLRARTLAVHNWHAMALFHENDNAQYWQAQRLERVIGHLLRMPVHYTPLDDFYGQQHPGFILINKRLSWTPRLHVLAHEAGHVFMPTTFPPQSSESEVFAEAVSHLVCLRLGYDNLEPAAHYLAQHKQALDVLTVYRAEIEYAAAVLTP